MRSLFWRVRRCVFSLLQDECLILVSKALSRFLYFSICEFSNDVTWRYRRISSLSELKVMPQLRLERMWPFGPLRSCSSSWPLLPSFFINPSSIHIIPLSRTPRFNGLKWAKPISSFPFPSKPIPAHVPSPKPTEHLTPLKILISYEFLCLFMIYLQTLS